MRDNIIETLSMPLALWHAWAMLFIYVIFKVALGVSRSFFREREIAKEIEAYHTNRKMK